MGRAASGCMAGECDTRHHDILYKAFVITWIWGTSLPCVCRNAYSDVALIVWQVSATTIICETEEAYCLPHKA